MMNSKAEISVLCDQQELLKTLNAQKRVDEKRYDVLVKGIEGLKSLQSDKPDKPRPPPVEKQFPPFHESNRGHIFMNNVSAHEMRNGAEVDSASEELEHYCALVNKLLAEIDAVQYRINYRTRSRIHTSVLDLHSKEVCQLRLIHGHHMVQKAFAHEPYLVS
jgi:hypothetical protein